MNLHKEEGPGKVESKKKKRQELDEIDKGPSGITNKAGSREAKQEPLGVNFPGAAPAKAHSFKENFCK